MKIRLQWLYTCVINLGTFLSHPFENPTVKNVPENYFITQIFFCVAKVTKSKKHCQQSTEFWFNNVLYSSTDDPSLWNQSFGFEEALISCSEELLMRSDESKLGNRPVKQTDANVPKYVSFSLSLWTARRFLLYKKTLVNLNCLRGSNSIEMRREPLGPYWTSSTLHWSPVFRALPNQCVNSLQRVQKVTSLGCDW